MGKSGEVNTIVITGASSGIGRACALQLDNLGYCVFAGVRSKQAAESLQHGASERLQTVLLDVTDPSSITHAMEFVRGAVGNEGLGALLNNAGIVVAGPLEAMPLDTLRHQFEVNVWGQVAVTQAFLPLIRQAKGRILNMSSISGRIALPMLGPYASSKFALEAMSDALRLEVYDDGIKVILIEPGSIDTPIWNKAKSKVEELQSEIPQPLRDHYQPLMTQMKQVTSESASHALPVGRVVDVVVHALTVSNPRPRYVVGASARTAALLKRLLPNRLFDAIILRKLRRG